MDTDVAACRLVDEHRHGDDVGTITAADADVRERIQRYIVRAGSVRRDPETAWVFGRRQMDEQFFLFEFGSREEQATLCLLPDQGILLADRGGSLFENEFVAAFLGGYYNHHDGAFELHAQPLDDEGIGEACAALVRTGLTTEEGDGRGPFADALGHIAAELASLDPGTDGELDQDPGG